MEKILPTKYLLCNGKIVKYDEIHLHEGAHVMGHICYVVKYGRRVTALKRWKTSTPSDQVPPLNPEIDSVVIGDVDEISCRHEGCNKKQDWYSSRAAAVALFVERYGFSEAALNAEAQEGKKTT